MNRHALPIDDDQDSIRVQVPLTPETVRRIDELAERMKLPRGRMSALLVEAAIDDHEWIINAVTSKYMQPVVKAIQDWSDLTNKNRAGKGKTKSA